jgi:hypothetical protein
MFVFRNTRPTAASLFLGCVLTCAAAAAPNLLQAQTLSSRFQASDVASTGARDQDFLKTAKLLYADNFQAGLSNWLVELEKPGRVVAENGVLDIDVPDGATLWFKHELNGPVMIEYEATVISAGGPNDRVSDLNCFWMATDPAAPTNLFANPRHGAFREYNTLLTYYVGLGGNYNTTTRFRRYIGSPTDRPLLPAHDLSAAQYLIQPNRTQKLRLVANGSYIAYYRDQQRLFVMRDHHPYTHGWFALRTTRNHMQVRNLRIYQLQPGPR